MNILFVVSRAHDWLDDIPGITILQARHFLTDTPCGNGADTRIVNLCDSYRYQGDGYYVSLLAEARGQQAMPSIAALNERPSCESGEEMHEEMALRNKVASLDDLAEPVRGEIDNKLDGECGNDFLDLVIYFGREPEARHAHICRQIFALLPLPILHIRLEKADGQWQVRSMRSGRLDDIPAQHRKFFVQAARDLAQVRTDCSCSRSAGKPSLAILCDPGRAEAPSNPEAIRKFRDAAGALGMTTEIITPGDARRITEFDGLFIRDTTHVRHPTYQCSRRAIDAGMVAIDDPESILRCTNKIYLFELLSRHRIPIPRTLVVHRGNIGRIVPTLGLPCILKQPDGAFSLGVMKIQSEQDLLARVEYLLHASELILAQEWLPTAFDWRVAVLDRRPLFVCKYYMAPGHWQVIKHDRHETREGRTEAMAVDAAPEKVVSLAVQAANLIGDGFYGVDLKQVGNRHVVIEINDNPNVDAGNEDAVLGDALYREVMGVFRKRIGAIKGSLAS